MAYTITKKKLLPQPVLLVRRRVKRSEIAATIGAVLPGVFQYAQQHGIAQQGPGIFFFLLHIMLQEFLLVIT